MTPFEDTCHMAESAFAEHELTTLCDRGKEYGYHSYRCGKPNSGTYGFNVYLVPGSVIVIGDIGDLIVSRVWDMTEWLRSVVGREDGSIDLNYLAQKVPQNIETRVWDAKACHEMVDAALETLSDGEDCGIDDDERLGLHDFSCEHSWMFKSQELCEYVDDFYEYGDSNDWCPRFLWLVCGLRWFMLAYDARLAEMEGDNRG